MAACWQSESGFPVPERVRVVDDTLSADGAFRLASDGIGLLWRGDFQNARQLLQAMGRRVDKKIQKQQAGAVQKRDPRKIFQNYRAAQFERARILGMLLIPVEAEYRIPLRRAPQVEKACQEVYGPCKGDFVLSLRELSGVLGAHEWRRRGVRIPALEASIHPHYGVYSPVRGEYLDLVASVPLPPGKVAFDIGTGTGVLAALLARRGVEQVVATDQDERALICARDNLERLGFKAQVKVVQADLFPAGKASLVVCNPPWLPACPTSPIEYAVYDPDSQMLRGFLAGLAEHLEPGGEGWLIISDLAEHLCLRSREELLGMMDAEGLEVLEKLDIQPRHSKTRDTNDPLHWARVREVTSLWRLRCVVHP
ncbi:MAG: methyltransferase [Azovibrio sp.]